jgi:hypothetical protein
MKGAAAAATAADNPTAPALLLQPVPQWRRIRAPALGCCCCCCCSRPRGTSASLLTADNTVAAASAGRCCCCCAPGPHQAISVAPGVCTGSGTLWVGAADRLVGTLLTGARQRPRRSSWATTEQQPDRHTAIPKYNYFPHGRYITNNREIEMDGSRFRIQRVACNIAAASYVCTHKRSRGFKLRARTCVTSYSMNIMWVSKHAACDAATNNRAPA